MARTSTALTNVFPTQYVEARFVEALRTNTLMVGLGRESTLPTHNSKTVRWQFFSNPAAVVATISTEGDAPADATLPTTTSAEATLGEYGGNFPYTRFLLGGDGRGGIAISGTFDELIDLVGNQAALSLDCLTLIELDNIAAGQKIDLGAAFTADGLRQGAADLAGAGQGSAGTDFPSAGRAMPHPATPGGQFYCAVLSPEAAYDMLGEGTPTWYQGKSRDVEAALTTPFKDTPATAAMYGCIVKITGNIRRNTSPTPDDDENYIVGKDLFGVAALDTNTMKPRVIVTTPEQNVASATRNSGSIAWWALFAAKLIDSNRGAQLLSDATGK